MEVHLHLPDTLSSFLLFQDLGKQERWVQFRKPPCIPRHLPGVNSSSPQCTSPRWLLPLYPSHQCFASQKPKPREPSWPKQPSPRRAGRRGDPPKKTQVSLVSRGGEAVTLTSTEPIPIRITVLKVQGQSRDSCLKPSGASEPNLYPRLGYLVLSSFLLRQNPKCPPVCNTSVDSPGHREICPRSTFKLVSIALAAIQALLRSLTLNKMG